MVADLTWGVHFSVFGGDGWKAGLSWALPCLVWAQASPCGQSAGHLDFFHESSGLQDP